MQKRLLLFLVGILFLSILFMTGCSHKHRQLRNPSATMHTSAARQRATMRSYEVMGKEYNPSYVEVGQVMKGVSSWYGPNFHGKRTSNGEVYNMHGYTAAHKTWPMDTMVRVHNLQNGKSTIVRINDRGPFVSGRIIDCSYAAGKKLGLDKMGIAKVSIEVLGFAGKIESSQRIKKVKKAHLKKRVLLSNFGIQLGAFRYYSGALALKRRYSRRFSRYHPIIKCLDTKNESFCRVWLMGFASEQEAYDFKYNNNLADAFIIRN